MEHANRAVDAQFVASASLERLSSFSTVFESIDVERLLADRASADLLRAPMPAVLDTNWIRTAFDWQLSHPACTPGTVEAAQDGTFRRLMAADTLDEAYARLPRFAAQLNTTVRHLEKFLVDEWLPSIRIVELPAISEDERVAGVAALDPDDVSAAHLATLLAPCVLLANDKDFRPLGVTGHAQPGALIAAAAQVDTSQSTLRVGIMLPAAPLMGAGAMARWLKARFGMSGWLTGSIGIVLTAAGVFWYRRQDDQTKTRVREAAMEAMTQYAAMIDKAQQEEAQARAALQKRIVEPVWPRSTESIVLRQLAYADEPMSAQDAWERLRREERPGVQAVREVLRTHPAAVEHGRGTWMLGWSGADLLVDG